MVSNAKAASKKPEPQEAPEPRWFTFYDPFLSVVGTAQPAFRDAKGTPLKFRPGAKSHANQLLYLAAEAVREMLPGIRLTREQWGNLIGNCSVWLKGLSDLFSAEDASKWQWRDGLGRPMPAPQAQQLGDFGLLSIVHQMIMRDPKGAAARGQPERVIYDTLWYVVALREIDDALMSLLFTEDAPIGITSAIRAASAIANAKAVANHGELPFKQDISIRGGFARARKDPRRLDKCQVYECWVLWKEDPSRYPSKAEFARDMLAKFDRLKNNQTIEDWCRKWEQDLDIPESVPS